MALLPATLANELIANLDNFVTEAEATVAWADSFDAYFQSAMAGVVPVTPLGTANAKNAMATALAGMSLDGAGSTKLVAGITAYWTQLNVDAFAVFLACTAITPPPGLGGLTGLLNIDFTANTVGIIAKVPALTTIANTIHTAQLGGIAVFPIPPGGIGPQVIV